MKAEVIYWTGSGNTQMIADSVFEALEDLNIESSIHYVSDIDVEDVSDADYYFLGCPSMSGENIEEYEFRPFFESLKPFLKNKPVVLFGSYDWGDGEWMVTWQEETIEAGADFKKALIYQWEPNDDQLKETYDFTQSLF